MFYVHNGIRIAGTGIWLDAGKRVPSSVVSHAHLDHAKKHQRIIATGPTLQLLKKRLGKTRTLQLEYGESYRFDGCDVTLFPAGHVLGSAQVLVERGGVRLLYSGDFNTVPSAVAEAIEVPGADILIMESTFGKEMYRFPPREQVEEQLLEFVTRTFAEGTTPIVVGYVLGKSQEAMRILCKAGFKLCVHGSVAALARIYEACGVDFGDWVPYHQTRVEGRVLVIPRIAINSRMVKRLEKKRIVYLSGWAVNPWLRERLGVDDALPLSDHADFDGLIEYAFQTGAEKIYTTHGFKRFARDLNARGLNAEPLSENNQLSLF